jgi:hypothetical protein
MSNCLVHTCQTVDEFNNLNWKLFPIQTSIPSKLTYQIPFYKKLDYKIRLEDGYKMYQYLKSNSENILTVIPWNYIEIPENIKSCLKKKLNFEIKDFYPIKYIINSYDNIYYNSHNCDQDHNHDHNYNPETENNKVLNFLREFEYYLHSSFGLDMTPELVKLLNCVYKEFETFINCNTTSNNNPPINMSSFMSNVYDKNSFFTINSKDYKQMIFVSPHMVKVLTDQYVLIIPNNSSYGENFMIITDKQIYIKNLQDIINIKISHDISNGKYTSWGYFKTETKKELFNFKINNKLELEQNYIYDNKETKTKLQYWNFTDYLNNEYSKWIKQNCEFEEYYNPDNKFRHIISQCMITNNSSGSGSDTGLRYRGKYTESNQNGKLIKKTIHLDDELKYSKEGEKVSIDTLERKSNKKDDFTIGYKVAKSELGDIRIVKLAIFPDAKIVRPIDEEFFITFGKERCDKAIVMDIQLPNRDEEISVVPEELSAFSYVHKQMDKTNKFEYKVGQEVLPDNFDPDENIGCAQGIHFYQDRITVFKAFID